MIAVSFLAAPGSALQAEDSHADVSWFARHQPMHAWLEPYDPTLISRRLLTQVEYEDREDGASSVKWLWNLRWAIPLQDDLALALSVEAPLRWIDGTGFNGSGSGDVESRVGIVGRAAPDWRWGLALNGKFPTATPSEIGDGVVELRPIAALRWDARECLNLGCNVEYSFTPRHEGGDAVSALELKFPAAIEITNRLSVFTSYNPRWNFANGDTLRHRLEIGLTRLFGIHENIALSMGLELPLSSSHDDLDWKGSMGLAWYF